jgi:hypothetical protein
MGLLDFLFKRGRREGADATNPAVYAPRAAAEDRDLTTPTLTPDNPIHLMSGERATPEAKLAQMPAVSAAMAWAVTAAVESVKVSASSLLRSSLLVS